MTDPIHRFRPSPIRRRETCRPNDTALACATKDGKEKVRPLTRVRPVRIDGSPGSRTMGGTVGPAARPRPALRALPLAGLLLAAALSARAEPAAVTVEIHNAGRSAMRCLLMFGHWVTRDLPLLAPGATVALVLDRQAEDGALYLLREDGRRRMMVETLLCGADTGWWETRADVPLAPLRQGAGRRLAATCRVEERVRCRAAALP